MVRLCKGNMLSAYGRPNSFFVVTTNALVRRNGALVMGRGAAKTFRDKFPGLDLECGKLVSEFADENNVYGFLPVLSDFGLFQVKVAYQTPARFYLVELSAKMLKSHVMQYPELTFHINYPGIGNGKLEKTKVKRLLIEIGWQKLDNLCVWSL